MNEQAWIQVGKHTYPTETTKTCASYSIFTFVPNARQKPAVDFVAPATTTITHDYACTCVGKQGAHGDQTEWRHVVTNKK